MLFRSRRSSKRKFLNPEAGGVPGSPTGREGEIDVPEQNPTKDWNYNIVMEPDDKPEPDRIFDIDGNEAERSIRVLLCRNHPGFQVAKNEKSKSALIILAITSIISWIGEEPKRKEAFAALLDENLETSASDFFNTNVSRWLEAMKSAHNWDMFYGDLSEEEDVA